MKHWVVPSLIGGMLFVGACQPEEACHGGKELSNGSCVEQTADAGSDRDAGGKSHMDASEPDAGGGSTPGGDGDSGMTGGSKVPYCSNRKPLVDEDKYGLQCDTANPGTTCGSLQCSFGYCNASCDLTDPCSCPGGNVCTDFGVSTACMPSWGWPCTNDGACRAEAPVCIENDGYCTSMCDPADPKSCPDTWKCVSTADGNVCQRK